MSQEYGVPQQPNRGMPGWTWLIIVPCGCLAVLAVVIAVLGASLFPVFSRARQTARGISCMSNEKQQALGIMMYVQDYDQKFPPSSAWMDVMDPYTKNQAIFKCPEAAAPSAAMASTTTYGYAYNSALSKQLTNKLRNPPTMPMLYDSTNLAKNASDAMTSLPNPPRHTRGNNIGYADGHVKSLGSSPSSQ